MKCNIKGKEVLIAVVIAICIFSFSICVVCKNIFGGDGFYRYRTEGIRVLHTLHYYGKGLRCESCHKGSSQSGVSADFLLPDREVCKQCHGGYQWKGELTEKCKACHKQAPEPYLFLKAEHKKNVEIVFSHARHVSGKSEKNSCVSCHKLSRGKKLDIKSDLKPSIPSMRDCLLCHKKEYKTVNCRRCHFTNKDGTMKKRLPDGRLFSPPKWMAGIEHSTQWIGGHAVYGANYSNLCAACHTEKDCDSCHKGSGEKRPEKFHEDDWMEIHPFRVSSGELRCGSCHNYQHFCLTCHRRSGVAWDSPEEVHIPSGSTFHPEGWYSYQGKSVHAEEAKRSIESCVSCHTESYCMKCHSAPFKKFSPHPPSPVWKVKCKNLYSKNPEVCFKCHSKSLVPDYCK